MERGEVSGLTPFLSDPGVWASLEEPERREERHSEGYGMMSLKVNRENF